MFRSALAASCCVAALSSPLLGQRSTAAPAPAGTGAILGVVTDSLHGGALSEALVTVIQRPRRSAMTSSTGAFRIDSLPPGRYTLDLQHPIIDSLGIRVVSETLTVAAGATRTTVLAVPAGGRIAAAVCPPLERKLGAAVLLGQVRDADTDTPAAGAQVSLVWTETTADQRGVHTVPHVRRATVERDGSYRLCGLPTTLTATLQASRGDARTAEVAVQTTAEPLALRFLSLPPPPRQPGHAVVTGQVTDARGVPVDGARVTIQRSAAVATTGKDGRFTLPGAPPGTQLVLVRRVGYDPVQRPLDITTRGPNRVAVRLGTYHERLAAVTVQTTPLASQLDRIGFTHRKQVGMGRYVTADEIAQEQPVYTSDVLRRIVGLHVFGSGHALAVTTARGDGCVRSLIDRNAVSAADGASIDELVRPQDIAAIEFYQPSEIPGELGAGSSDGCALLVVWTVSQLPPLTPPR